MKSCLNLSLSLFALTLFCRADAQNQNLFLSGFDHSQNDAGYVDEYTQSGAFVRHFVPLGSGGLAHPYNLRFGPNGNLFVTSTTETNSTSSAIKEYNGQTGAFMRNVYLTPGAGASDLLFDRQGDLYLADPSAQQALKIDPSSGTLLRSYSVGTNSPASFAFLSDGNLVFTDGAGLELTELNVVTGATSLFGSLHHVPRGIAAGPDGRYYIMEPLGIDGGPGPDNTIEVVGSSGGTASAWSQGGTVGYFAVFSNGDMYSSGTGPAPGSGVNRVSVFDVSSGQFLRHFDTGLAPIGIALGPTTTAVPEPGVLALFGASLAGGLWFLRRRK